MIALIVGTKGEMPVLRFIQNEIARVKLVGITPLLRSDPSIAPAMGRRVVALAQGLAQSVFSLARLRILNLSSHTFSIVLSPSRYSGGKQNDPAPNGLF